MIKDIWMSFRYLPLWVQIWVLYILVPANMASLAIINEPYGLLIAGLAIGGMVPNVAIIFAERGFSKAMALPHVLIWTPLVVIVAIWLSRGGPDSNLMPQYLPLLLAVNTVSLCFDYKDAWDWLHGAREVARPNGHRP